MACIRRHRLPSELVPLIFVLAALLGVLACQKKEDGAKPGPYEYPADFSFVEVPDPLAGSNPLYPEESFGMPDIGVPFRDPAFATRITRATRIDGINGRHEYSRFDPFNADKSMIVLLTESGDYAVYSTVSMPYNQPGNLVLTTSGTEDPRWDVTDPALLWGLHGFQIVCDNVHTGQRWVIKDFASDAKVATVLAAESDLFRITMLQEGEASADQRYWALVLQGSREDYRPRYLLCWDRQLDLVEGFYRLAGHEANIDWVGMSVKGNWVLVGGMHDNGGNFCGLTMADRNLQQFYRLDYTTAHADVGLDADGSEVVVMQNIRTDYIDMLPLDPKTRPILESGGSYDGTNRIRLVRLYYESASSFGCNSGVHISCNMPGYCLVSTNISRNTPEQNWLDRSNILVRLDPRRPRAFYLSKIYNTTDKYFEETHGAISNDGSRIVWAANWNRDVGAERMFLLQLDMPQTWRRLTGGN